MKNYEEMKKDLTSLEIILKWLVKEDNPNSWTSPQESALKAALRSESLAARIRKLDFSSLTFPKDVYQERAWGMGNIQVSAALNCIQVRFPGMLPKKTEGKSLLLGRALQAAVKKAADEADFPQLLAASICFIHFYTPDTPISVMRDYDNLETRPVLDILAASCLEKKNFSAVFHRMEFGDTNHAEIFAMEPQDMIFWLSGRKKEGCQ